MATKDDNVDALRSKWTALYSKTLPKLAREKNAAQPKWPVTLDHCFARIILDNTVGRGVLQWDNVIDRPAVKNMNESQLQEAIALGEKIQSGQVDLVELDKKSLKARGKGEKKYKNTKKRELESLESEHANVLQKSKKPKRDEKSQSTLSFAKADSKSDDSQEKTAPPRCSEQSTSPASKSDDKTQSSFPNPNTVEFLDKIRQHVNLTPYRKRLYSTLLSVPPGHYTTYQAMATFLDSSARAVGSGMRNNPYAPDVPCHRVLASDGSIGGFGGSWGQEGKHAGKKRDLLKSEGVHFDSKGRVKGPVFRSFNDLSTAITS